MFGRSDFNRIDGDKYLLVDRPIDDRLERLLNRSPANIHICDSHPDFGSLRQLLPWTDRIERLIVTDYGVDDVDVVEQFVRLRSLSLFPAARATVDFAGLEALRDLALNEAILPKLRRARVETLLLEKPRPAVVNDAADLTSLRSLRLAAPRALPESFGGGRIADLTIASFRWKKELIAGLESLESLTLDGVRGIRNLEPFASAKTLSKLVIEDCPDFVSLDGVRLSPNASVILIGDTPARKP